MTQVSLESSANRRHTLAILLLTVVVCSVYLWVRLPHGSLPEDDGLLGQSALRVLHGQLPHVDFVENYTGGLNYVHAAAFRLFGVNAFSMRIALFALSIPFLLSVFYIASRLAGAKTAAFITVLTAVWSVPVYPTPMPSWYNLYLAVFGAAALTRYIDDRRKHWLFLAGIAGGISFDIKVVGLYYIAGVLLFLIFDEQENSGTSGAQAKRSYAYSVFMVGGLVMFIAGVAKLVGGNMQEGDAIHFLLPSAVIAGLLIWREIRTPVGSNRKRFFALFGTVIPFVAGCAVPVALLLVSYVRGGNVRVFFAGVFLKGLSRAHELSRIHAELPELGLALPPLLLLFGAKFWKRAANKSAVIAVCILLAVALVLAIRSSALSESVFYSASMMTPWVTVFGAWMLASRHGQKWQSGDRLRVMLLVSLAALCSLVQYPFPAAVYFCYFAPLLAVALLALASAGKAPLVQHAAFALVLFYALFGLARLVPANIAGHGDFKSRPAQSTLRLERAGGIKAEDPGEYENMIHALQSHARNSYIVAVPECPDVYFFSGLETPATTDGTVAPPELDSLLGRDDIYAVVLNRKPYFSDSNYAELIEAKYRERFPHTEAFGKYLLMWR